MQYKIVNLTLIFLLLFFPAKADNELKTEGFPGIVVKQTRYYDGSSLWGYMNGGADLFLEYGFRQLCSQKVVLDGENFIVDIFQMGNPLGAFGIFSVNRFRCQTADTLQPNDCLNRYQYQFVRNNYYINIVNETGSAKAQECLLKIHQWFNERIPLNVPHFPKELGNTSTSVKLLMGPIAVSNHATQFESILLPDEAYVLWKITNSKFLITTKTTETQQRIMQQLREDDSFNAATQNLGPTCLLIEFKPE